MMDRPNSISIHRLRKPLRTHIRERNWLPDNARVCEEHIQPAVLLQGVSDNGLHGFLVGRVELPRVDVDAWVQRLDLALVGCKMRGVVIADVDCFGAVVRVLVGTGAANAGGGVGS